MLVGLLVSTAAAFAVTERLKLTKSAIYGTHVSKLFSPTCSCARGRANVHVVLRRADTVTVTVLDSRGRPAALIAAGSLPPGPVTFHWNGRTDTGARARDGGPVACLGLALFLVATTRRERIAGLAFAALGACVLGAAVAPHRPVVILGGIFAALGLGVGLAGVFRAQPWLFPIAALACLPARIGVHIGVSGSKLLVPLYVVIFGAALSLAWELVEGDRRARELRGAAWPLALYVGWTGLSLAWSKDAHDGAIELLAFYLPFTLLAIGIARLPWSRLGLRVLYAEITIMAVVFAIVGFYQYETRDIFQNPKVITSNAYAPFFRVNSVFWDPSIYGRFLVVAMVASIVAIVRWRSPRIALV